VGTQEGDRDGEANRLKIRTLGQFVVRCGDAVLTEEAGRSQKLWDLFTYFLRNRERLVPPDTIAAQLWPEADNADPKAAVQDLIYRMRRLFRDALPSCEDLIRVDFSQGCYSFYLGDACWCDVDEFLELTEEASRLIDDDAAGAVDALQRCVDLYRGHYLPEWPHQPWILPVRQYYRRIYVRNLMQLTDLLRDHDRYPEVIDVCERAFMLEPLPEAEELHHRFMEALVRVGRPSDALEHYEFLSGLMKQQLDVAPGESLRELCELIRSDREIIESEQVDRDLSSVSGKLMRAEEVEGALLCDREVFRYLYRLEMRRAERVDDRAVFGIITLTDADGDVPDRAVLERATPQLEEVLLSNLRRGDVIAQWNGAQVLVLLSAFRGDDAIVCFSRIERGFSAGCSEPGIALEGRFRAVADEIERDLQPH